MAKEKIELTPEEKAAKKIKHSNGWVRFWAIVVAFALTAALFSAAKKGIGAPETKEVAAAGTNTNNNNSNNNSASSNNNNSNTNNSSSNSNDTSSGSNANNSGDANTNNGAGTSATADTAAIIKKFNDATAKAVSSKAGYYYNKSTEYVPGQEINVTMFGGDATKVLNQIISGVASGSDLNSVVGNFIGIGGRKAPVPKGQEGKGILEGTDGWTMYDYEALSVSQIKESDVSNASISGNKITMTLKDAATPTSGDGSSLANLTENFLTLDRVNTAITDGLKGTSVITVQDSSTVQYSNIKVECEIDDAGNFVNYKIFYTFAAALDIKAVLTIKGTGAADAVISYSDFKY